MSPNKSVTWAKKGCEQAPVSRGRPSNIATVGAVPMRVVKAASIRPVTVDSSEFVVDGVTSGGSTDCRVSDTASSEKTGVLTPGEHPTKLGADSFTVLHVAILNAIAPCRVSPISPIHKQTSLTLLIY